MIAAAAISTALLADDSVTVAKLGPGSVDSTALGDDRLAYLHALLNTGSCEKMYSEFSIMVITTIRFRDQPHPFEYPPLLVGVIRKNRKFNSYNISRKPLECNVVGELFTTEVFK